MNVLAIDPGNKESAYVIWDGRRLLDARKCPNMDLLVPMVSVPELAVETVVIEQVRSMGMPVGATVFDTVHWSGRFEQVYYDLGIPVYLLPRMKVKMHICGNSRAKDGNIAQALRDRFGEKPTKKKPNEVYGFFKPARDVWQAWALAVTWLDTRE